jgi:hypothetical protein
MMTPDFKSIIAEALTGTTVENPRALSELIGYVDAPQKLIINYDELHDSLEDLVESGVVEQIGDRYYMASAASANPGSFSGFSYETYRKAEQEYRKRFWKTYNELRRRQP